jgi:excisionase family DNA binding protein
MTYPCSRCGEPVIYSPDWPACACDTEPGLSLTVRQTAAYLCVSVSKVRDMIARGEVIINRTRRPARIPVTSIKAFLTTENRAWRLGEGIYRNR